MTELKLSPSAYEVARRIGATRHDGDLVVTPICAEQPPSTRITGPNLSGWPPIALVVWPGTAAMPMTAGSGRTAPAASSRYWSRNT